MANTYATQIRIATVTDRAARYKVTMVIDDRGDLPDKAVFLKEIIDPDDPKEDGFARIAKVGDVIVYPTDRDAAIATEDSLWRDTELTKIYDDLDAAKVAADFMQERVNALVTEYSDYATNFEADPGESLVFPQDDIGALAPLVDDYTAKVEARKAQEEYLEEKEEECDELQEDYDDAKALADKTQTSLDILNKVKTYLEGAQTVLQTHYNASDDLASDIVGSINEWNTQKSNFSDTNAINAVDNYLVDDATGLLYDEYYNNFKDDYDDLNQKLTEITSQLTDINAQINDLESNVLGPAESDATQLLSAKESCEVEKAEAQAVLDTLERQESDLLQQIQDLCPGYTGS